MSCTPAASCVARSRGNGQGQGRGCARGLRRALGPRLGPTVGVLVAIAAAGPAAAQTDGPPPSPAEFHGYELGTRYTLTSHLYDYYRALAGASRRVEYSEYGESIQGRTLPMVMISSEANLARADEIRGRMRSLTNVTGPLEEAALDRLVEGTPAVVWIFIVDTDEEAGVEVLQEVAHELATRDDAATERIRENVLVIMTPLTNPDSHARYVTWHMLYDVDGASLDPNAIENDAHWGMNTDGNAYGIDVNRDFGWFVTPEMRALAREATAWRPQLWLDIHSGPNVIFIPPFPRPYHPLWPEQAVAWWGEVGERAGEAFGRRGWTFNSRQGYEGVTSVGFGLSWGMVGPSVSGLLFESFGGRPGKTTAFRRADGNIATLREAMDHHAVGIRSLLELAADRREELLRDAHEVVVTAVEEARSNELRGLVVPAEGPGVDPDKVARLIERLTLQGVEVRRATGPFRTEARDLLETGRATRSFAAGSYIVDFVQPNARLARTLLDPTIDYGDPQVDVPFGRSLPYYDTTWGTLSLMFGVPSYGLREMPGVPTEPVTEVARPAGRVFAFERAEPPYGYLLPAGTEANYRVAIRLMRDGYKLKSFRGPTTIEGVEYPKGSWGLIARRNPGSLHERIHELTDEMGGTLVEVSSPYTDAGVTFGDEVRLVDVPDPLVAVLADWPVAQDHIFGGIRTVLEADFGFGFSPVMMETINEADLSKYTAVVLPHAGMSMRGGANFSAGYRGLLETEKLREYVRGGGTLIAVKGAGTVIAEDPVLGEDVDFDGWATRTSGATLRAVWDASAAAEAGLAAWRPGLGDVGLPVLAAGYESPDFAAPGAYPAMLSVDPEGSAEVVARYGGEESLVVDGFVLPSDVPKVAGRPFLVVDRIGAGRVIYVADDPTFRGHWYGLNTMFLNMLVLGPTL